MTPQEAYNKGLDDAERLAVVKLSNALLGDDDGPFNNPQMEEIRQTILNRLGEPYTLRVLLDKEVIPYESNSLDTKVFEILTYIKDIAKSKSKNKISVKLRGYLRDLEVDFIKNYGKLE